MTRCWEVEQNTEREREMERNYCVESTNSYFQYAFAYIGLIA